MDIDYGQTIRSYIDHTIHSSTHYDDVATRFWTFGVIDFAFRYYLIDSDTAESLYEDYGFNRLNV